MSRVTRGYESRRVRVEGEPLYQGTLGAGDLGSSRNHLSYFIHYTFNTKIIIYRTSGNQDTTVLYEPSDRRC